jgi:hypothetical protein
MAAISERGEKVSAPMKSCTSVQVQTLLDLVAMQGIVFLVRDHQNSRSLP